jgi:DNA-binding NarL/FixJ family response regulator
MAVERPTVRLFLADDHVIVRQSLKHVLESHGYQVVGEASDGRSAVDLCRLLRPDIVILDIAMPILNGVEAAQQLRTHYDVKIILLTMHVEHQYVTAALCAGVTGYVLKTAAASQLIEAIEAMLAGDHYLSPSVSRVMLEDYVAHRVDAGHWLSTREREVLQLIAEGKNMKEIGALLGISARTAETHRARLMAKLNIHDVAGLVRYAIQQGIAHLNAS